jgi:predicted nuclease of restriction endonuclease-like (RecB) superfamily
MVKISRRLLERLKTFLLVLGKGFAFAGRNKKRRLI